MRCLIVIAVLSLTCAAAVTARDKAIIGGIRPHRDSRTIADHPADIMHEDFEGDWPPAGWAVLHLGDSHSWEPTHALAHSGDTAAWLQYGPAGTSQHEWLVSGPLDLSGMGQAAMEFYEDGAYWDAWGDHHYIMVSATSQTDVNSFTAVLDMRPDVHDLGHFDGLPIRADLSSFAGEPEVYVAFRYVGNNSDHWFVDDCRVFEPFLHDLAIEDVSPNDQNFTPGSLVNPVVQLGNRGLSFENRGAMRLEIRESGTVVRVDTISSLTLAPNQTLSRSFPAYQVADGHWYELEASVILAVDGNPTNNTDQAVVDTYTRPRTPLGMFLTNNHNPDCTLTELALDSYILTQNDDAALIRIHVGSPIPDAVYSAAPAANMYLMNVLGAGAAPHLWLDGTTNAGSVGSQYPLLYEQRKTAGSPMDMTMAWNPILEQALVSVDIVELLSPGTVLSLRVAVTEDAVDELGANGLRYHDQSLRAIYPDTSGAVLSPATGRHPFTIACPVDPDWDLSRLRCTAWVRNETTGRIQQTVTDMITDMSTVVGVDQPLPRTAPTIETVSPNPFNPATSIAFSSGRAGTVRLEIFDLGGRLVRTLLDDVLPAGRHSVEWDGRDDQRRDVGSGSYCCRVSSIDGKATRRLTLIR